MTNCTFSALVAPHKQDFKLPLAIYKEFYRKEESSFNIGWSRIKRNIYIDIDELKLDEPDKCNCSGDQQCETDDCSNRCIFIECSPGNCSKDCKNQRIGKFQYLNNNEYSIKFNPRKGWSVHADIKLFKGEYLMEYTGEVISLRRFKQRQKEMKDKRNFYFLQFQNRIIDAFKKGSDARFVNHSCDPNTHTEVWTVENKKRLGLFASRDIEIGEELTYNYNYTADESYPCFCGSRNCTGIMGKKIEYSNVAQSSKANKTKSNRHEVTIPLI